MNQSIQVNTQQPYEVLVAPAASEELAGLIAELPGVAPDRIAVIYPPPMAERAERVLEVLVSGGAVVELIEVPEGEGAKTGPVLQQCWDRLAEAGFTRSDIVLGLGGGSTTDLAGFVAATWLRGVRFINLPTTVLGMVDAAVGGKTGINTPAGKNLVGAFYEPIAVLCDLDLLQSLSLPELRSGMAEVIKCGLIADPSILDLIDRAGSDAVLNPASPVLAELVAKAVQVKATVVAGDLRESSNLTGGARPGREVLNYGHTLGHAIERVEDFTLRHGEAISLGMVFAAELSHRSGVLEEGLVTRHRNLLSDLGLPTTWSGDFDPLLAAMRLDKKTRGNQLRFVILRQLAEPVILAGADEQLLRESFAALAGHHSSEPAGGIR